MCDIHTFLLLSWPLVLSEACVLSSGWILHVYPADAHHCASPGVYPQPDDGVHSPIQPVF